MYCQVASTCCPQEQQSTDSPPPYFVPAGAAGGGNSLGDCCAGGLLLLPGGAVGVDGGDDGGGDDGTGDDMVPESRAVLGVKGSAGLLQALVPRTKPAQVSNLSALFNDVFICPPSVECTHQATVRESRGRLVWVAVYDGCAVGDLSLEP